MTIYTGQLHRALLKNGEAFSIGPSRGAAQLALALLYDVTRDWDTAIHFQMKFKWEVVAKLPMDKLWKLTSEDIQAWLLLEQLADA